MKLKYKVLSSIWIVLIAICLFTFYSYAMWVINLEGQSENKIKVTCFNTSFQEDVNGASISLYNTYPVPSEKALRDLSPYVFTISNECQDGNSVDYTVTLNRVNNDMGDAFVRVLILDEAVNFNTLTSEQIASYVSRSKIVESLTDLTNDDNVRELLQYTPVKSYELTTGTLAVETNKTYYLYAWIDSAATQSDVGGKKYEASVDVLMYTAYHDPSEVLHTAHVITYNAGFDSSEVTPGNTIAQFDITYAGNSTSANDYTDISVTCDYSSLTYEVELIDILSDYNINSSSLSEPQKQETFLSLLQTDVLESLASPPTDGWYSGPIYTEQPTYAGYNSPGFSDYLDSIRYTSAVNAETNDITLYIPYQWE